MGTNTRIAIVEDDADLSSSLCSALEKAGYQVSCYLDGVSALCGLVEQPPDLVLLDLNLPDLDGLSLCRELRDSKHLADLPVIMLTARADERDRILGLDTGADDYVSKPFSLRELKSRIRALLRRRDLDLGVPDSTYRDQRLEIDRAAMKASLDGDELHLTNREMELLWFLITRRPRVVTREQLVETIWGLSSEIETRTVDVHIRALRKKLGKAAIETIVGAGYRFCGYD